MVKHYAGTVKYTVHGWVDRNMDNVPQAFGTSLASSSHEVLYRRLRRDHWYLYRDVMGVLACMWLYRKGIRNEVIVFSLPIYSGGEVIHQFLCWEWLVDRFVVAFGRQTCGVNLTVLRFCVSSVLLFVILAVFQACLKVKFLDSLHNNFSIDMLHEKLIIKS